VETKLVKVSWNLFYAGWRAYQRGQTHINNKISSYQYQHWLRGWEAALTNSKTMI